MKIANRVRLLTKLLQNARELSFAESTGVRQQQADGVLTKQNFQFQILNSEKESANIFKSTFLKDFLLFEDFVTEDEEKCLLEDSKKPLARLKYEYDHWDGVICGYRELEKSSWGPESTNVLKRIQETVFDEKSVMLPAVHVLDLSSDGYIKPHVDSKFCGRRIAGLSLLSPAIMRLKPSDVTEQHAFVDVLLKPRSLYIMRDFARYELTHEILADKESYLGKRKFNRERRISIVLREEPPS
ncbi:alpha-ketoglutarate-dependent dioxygenase alkB homolog 7, mitochondrial-like [Rhopilema esculentum]|uniref:alpha-ketoglutarate-dependent dioxygenase alkB homolog 7, mitochondrial-like n=1 Tax=Rhopilema esculentum TaxID=499914 RepID=UPI0031CDBCED|eukprot:gene4951-21296_t